MVEKIRDLVIIGAGPSGLAAAIYTAREDIDTVVYEKHSVGGMVATIDHVENYPGYSEGVTGFDLSEQLEKQAKRFGAQIEFGEVTSIDADGDYKIVTVNDEQVKTKAVLIATGRGYGKMGVPGETEFFGKGVHYCATCDGAFYRGKKLAVVGGGNSAIQEAIFLTRFATHIDLLIRSTIKATKVLQHDLDKSVKQGKITVHLGTDVKEIIGTDGHVSSVQIVEDGKQQVIDVSGVFIFAGLKPNSGFVDSKKIGLHESGFVSANGKFETSMPGVFTCGDIRNGATMQIASAVGDGVTAALHVREYLSSFKG